MKLYRSLFTTRMSLVSATHRNASDSNANLHNERPRSKRNTTASDRREATP